MSAGAVIYREKGSYPMLHKRKRLPLKNVYYISFICFIVIPILAVLTAALLILNQQFKNQAIENIKRSQEAIVAELTADIDNMSMRLSHLIYTNNNEILDYAAGTDTMEFDNKYIYEQKLARAGNLALEPVKEIISVGFYMKDGRATYIKNDIHRSQEEIRETAWYQAAMQKPNTVCVGAYDTVSLNDLFTGGRKDLLILVFALGPDVTTDRSQRIEMVMFYQSTEAADKIKENNISYLAGKNKLGITQLTDAEGQLIFSTREESFASPEFTCIRTPIDFNETRWYIENYIKTEELTADYRNTAVMVLLVAVLVLLLAGYYSRYFLRSIVEPVTDISEGLRQVEEGNLEIHIDPKGQFEVRNMIHQFNAMVRRLKNLIEDYEQRVKSAEKSPGELFTDLVQGRMLPEEVHLKSKSFFLEHYAILGFYVEGYKNKETEQKDADKLANSFIRNPRFASRCILGKVSSEFFFVFYRITEDDYVSRVVQMIQELQKAGSREFGVDIAVCIGKEAAGFEVFEQQLQEIRDKMCLRHLEGAAAVIDLNKKPEETDRLLGLSADYDRLAHALYIADEKNIVQEKEELFENFNNMEEKERMLHVYAVILAIGKRFSAEHSKFADIFGQQYNYVDKLSRLGELRNLKLWLTNYFAWIMDYSASKLNVYQTDVIVKAKRYIADHYEDADLSLNQVGEYVGLNEKYFTNRFTKETGETFSSYLTGLRMQKARELLKTTNFKIYEIAAMVGYHNVEHFNRMFKKLNGITPAQFRKGGK